MATRIYLMHGNGKPNVSDFGSQGEIAIDLQDYRIWTLSQDGSSVEMLGSDISSETIDWSQLDNVPTEFPPSDHLHSYAEVTEDGTAIGKTLESEIADILTHLNTIDSELGSLAGNLTFAGTVQMSTGTITSVTDAGSDSGFSVGPIPADPPSGSDNLYFVCENGGTFDGGTYNGGDWLVSEGQGKGWTGIHFDSTINVLWDDIGSKPTEFPPEPHNQDISTINGLQDILDGLSVDGHTHVITDVDGLEDALNDKASVHQISCGTY
jgi:hypothetical protein